MSGICINITYDGSANSCGNSNGSYGTSSSQYKGDWSYKELPSTKISNYDNLFRRAGDELEIDWRLVAAHSFRESSWNPNAKSKISNAGGLYGFMDSAWKDYAKGYEATSNKYKPEIATEAYINLMRSLLKKFSNAISSNDRILLSLQAFHDGSSIKGTSWANVINGNGNRYTKEHEGKNYVPKIMNKFKELGGKIS